MSQHAPPLPADAVSMELDAPAINLNASDPAAAAAATAAADLLQMSAVAAAAACQSRADVGMMFRFVQAEASIESVLLCVAHRCV